MISNSTVYVKFKIMIPVMFLALSLCLGVTKAFAKTEGDEVNVLNLEIRENIESEIINWNQNMGYIEISVDLKEINFNLFMNGRELDSENYSLNENKDKLYIHSSFLSNLDLGEYKIIINNLDQEEIVRKIFLNIDAEGTTSSSEVNTGDESKIPEGTETNSTKSTETKASSSKDENSSGKVSETTTENRPITTTENNPISTSKNIVSPVRPEFDKTSEYPKDEPKPEAKGGTVRDKLSANLNYGNSKTLSSSEKSTSPIASTGVGANILPILILVFALGSVLFYKKHRYEKY